MMSLNQQFNKFVRSPLSEISVEDFKPLALAIWYEGFTPNVYGLKSNELQKAGYLLDRLMRFNCVSDDRKLELMKIVSDVRLSLKQNLHSPLSLADVEPLAQKWNLDEDISLIIQQLLPFQTRHYQLSRR